MPIFSESTISYNWPATEKKKEMHSKQGFAFSFEEPADSNRLYANNKKRYTLYVHSYL